MRQDTSRNGTESGFGAVDVRSLHERVYDEMRHALFQGTFSLGQALTIRGLAATFGTSEMPVREAIKRLVAEKMIVQMSNRTFQVPMLDWSQFEDILSLRISVEGFAAQRAIPFVNEELVHRLRQHNEQMREALLQGDRKAVLKENQAFHFDIYSASGSEVLLEMIERLWLRTGPYLSEALTKIEDSEVMFRNATTIHDSIVEALVAGDAQAVFDAVKLDLWTLAQWYEKRVGRLEGRFDELHPLPTALLR